MDILRSNFSLSGHELSLNIYVIACSKLLPIALIGSALLFDSQSAGAETLHLHIVSCACLMPAITAPVALFV